MYATTSDYDMSDSVETWKPSDSSTTKQSDDHDLVDLNQASHFRGRMLVTKKTRISGKKNMWGSSAKDVEADAMVDEVVDEGTATRFDIATVAGRGNAWERCDQFREEKKGFGEDNQNVANDNLITPFNPTVMMKKIFEMKPLAEDVRNFIKRILVLWIGVWSDIWEYQSF